MNSQLASYSELLDSFSRLGFVKPNPPTFMEVAGIGTKELAASNILAFLLDLAAEHGFDNLWFKSLMEAAALSGNRIAAAYEDDWIRFVERERVTAKGNRIDLLVHGESVLVCIENKILASLYNDLEDYAATITRDAANESVQPIYLVLSIADLSSEVASRGFTSVTYRSLFERVRANIKDRGESATPWSIFAYDFMRTIENLEPKMNDTFSAYIHQNWDEASRFLETIEHYRTEQLKHCWAIAELIDSRGRVQGSNLARQWNNYLGAIVIHNSKQFEDHPLTIKGKPLQVSTEAWMCKEGWRIWCWLRGNKGASPLLWSKMNEIEALSGRTLSNKSDGTLEILPPDASDEEIADAIEREATVAERVLEELTDR